MDGVTPSVATPGVTIPGMVVRLEAQGAFLDIGNGGFTLRRFTGAAGNGSMNGQAFTGGQSMGIDSPCSRLQNGYTTNI